MFATQLLSNKGHVAMDSYGASQHVQANGNESGMTLCIAVVVPWQGKTTCKGSMREPNPPGLACDKLGPVGFHNVAGLGLHGPVLCCPPPLQLLLLTCTFGNTFLSVTLTLTTLLLVVVCLWPCSPALYWHQSMWVLLLLLLLGWAFQRVGWADHTGGLSSLATPTPAAWLMPSSRLLLVPLKGSGYVIWHFVSLLLGCPTVLCIPSTLLHWGSLLFLLLLLLPFPIFFHQAFSLLLLLLLLCISTLVPALRLCCTCAGRMVRALCCTGPRLCPLC
jgi:hypothetical protein